MPLIADSWPFTHCDCSVLEKINVYQYKRLDFKNALDCTNEYLKSDFVSRFLDSRDGPSFVDFHLNIFLEGTFQIYFGMIMNIV